MSYSAIRSNYVSLTIDGKILGKEYMQNFLRAEYNEDASDLASSALVVSFADQNYKLADSNIKEGSTISAVFGYSNDYGKIFDGKITTKAISGGEEGAIVTTLTAMDNSIKMSVNEEPMCFKDLTDNEVIEQVAKKCGLKTKFGSEAQKNQIKRKVKSLPAGISKLEAVVKLAKDNGNMIRVEGDTLYIQKWGDFDNKAYVFDYKMGNYNMYNFSADSSVNKGGKITKDSIVTSDINKDTGKVDAPKSDTPSEKSQGDTQNSGSTFISGQNVSSTTGDK